MSRSFDFSERATGLEPATLTLAIEWSASHASPPVSAVPLSRTFLALLSHPSHQIAGVDSVSLVISLVGGPRGWLSRRGRPADRSVPARRHRGHAASGPCARGYARHRLLGHREGCRRVPPPRPPGGRGSGPASRRSAPPFSPPGA